MSRSDRGSVRIFLDTGVIIDGCVSYWSAAKALLIMLSIDARYTVVLAERIEEELAGAALTRSDRMTAPQAAEFLAAVDGWLRRVRLERLAAPSDDAIRVAMSTLLPALRHANDIEAVVAAIEAQPDWVISTNRAHWNDDLTRRSGLRIATPHDFLLALQPPA
ncbi:MAG: PIN domain-containing protein [Thermomicrobiales bacterium]